LFKIAPGSETPTTTQTQTETTHVATISTSSTSETSSSSTTVTSGKTGKPCKDINLGNGDVGEKVCKNNILYTCGGDKWSKESDCKNGCAPDGKSCNVCGNPPGQIGDSYCGSHPIFQKLYEFHCSQIGWSTPIECLFGCTADGKNCATCKPGSPNGWFTCKKCNSQGSGWDVLPEGTSCTTNSVSGSCDKYGQCVPTDKSKCTSYTYPEGVSVHHEGYEGQYDCFLAYASSSVGGGWWYNLVKCENSVWKIVKSCWVWQCDSEHHTCERTDADYKSENCLRKASPTKSCINDNAANKVYSLTARYACNFGQGEDTNCLVGQCVMRVVDRTICPYGCSNGECNPSPQPVSTTGSIRGQVTDATTGTPISFITVVATMSTGTGRSGVSTTQSGGWYEIDNLEQGSYQVSATDNNMVGGYQSSSQIVQVVKGQTITVNFALYKK
jgi:hypothetical protein